MKKFLALILSLILVFSLATVALADENDSTGTGAQTGSEPNDTNSGAATGNETQGVTPGNAEFYKQYGHGTTFASTLEHPNEEVTFTVKCAADNPDRATNATFYGFPKITASATLGTGENINSTYNENGDTSTIQITDTDYKKLTDTDRTNEYGQKLYVHFPIYKTVGKYVYTIEEKTSSTQGVTADTGKMTITVLVVYQTGDTVTQDATNGYPLLAKAYITQTSGSTTKKLDFQNTYTFNDLKVKKVVAGNLASKTEKFYIDVTLTSDNPVYTPIKIGGGLVTSGQEKTLAAYVENAVAQADDVTVTAGDSVTIVQEWTKGQDNKYTAKVTLQLADTDTCLFAALPSGVKYSVAEQNQHEDEDKTGGNAATGYTIKYAESDTATAFDATEISNKEISANADTTAWAVVQNTKETSVTTGVILDSAPYVLLLAVAVIGLVLFLSKKRAARD